MRKYAGEEFLNKIYKDLYKEKIVINSGKGRNKNEDVSLYMDRLDRVTNMAIDNDHLNVIKRFYHDKYIIKREDIPESYFELKKKIALERGEGHLEFSESGKEKEISDIIENQEMSLDVWIDYFSSKDTEMYPTWFKYFCFQGMTRLGNFNKEKRKFNKRTKHTTNPFSELNREAIAYVYDELVKLLDNRELSDKEIETLLNNGSFSKIYAYSINKINSIKVDSNNLDGIWKKYNQGSNPEILFNDINGKGTGWCTAGSMQTAESHLNGGDFYVYFTKDDKDNYTIPRVAIRTDYGSIAEIRGIDKDQNIEEGFEEIIDKKLDEFPDKEKYKKRVNDMRMLTSIYNKNINNIDLTTNELRFLYEIDDEINGFGWQKDPRIEEIIKKRIETGKYDTDINNFIHFDDIELQKKEWKINTEKKLKLIENLTEIKGQLFIPNDFFEIYFRNLKSNKNLVIPNSFSNFLCLEGLESLDHEFVVPSNCQGIELTNLKSIKNLIIPDDFTGSIYLYGLEHLDEKFIIPSNCKHINLNKLKSNKNLIVPSNFKGWIDLRQIESLDYEFVVPSNCECIDLDKLKSNKNLVIPNDFTGKIQLNGVRSLDKKLVVPPNCRYMDLRGLRDVDNILKYLVVPRGDYSNIVLDDEVECELDSYICLTENCVEDGDNSKLMKKTLHRNRF